MDTILAFVQANLVDLITVLTYIVAAASLIANMTPTETDNAIVASIKKVIDYLALNFKK